MSKKKKIIIILSTIIPAVVLVALALTLVFTLKPGKADKPEVIAYSQSAYISATYKQNYSYRFRFTANGKNVELDSQSNVLELTDALWEGRLSLGTEYSIQTCLVEPNGVLAGNWSDAVTHTFTLKLASPVVEFDEDSGIISWQSVVGAEKYYVCYQDSSELVKVETAQTQFEVSALKGGERQIYVTAASSKPGLTESDKSNTIGCTIEHTLAPILTAYIDDGGILTLTCSDNLSEIELISSSGTTVVKITSAELVGPYYRLSASIKGVYNPELNYSVRPRESAHNHYSGASTEVQPLGA